MSQLLPDLRDIRRRRQKLGISQRKMARKLGISQSMVAKIEAESINPSYRLVQKIFGYLNGMQAVSMGRARDVASKPLYALRRSHTVGEAVKMLQERGFKQLPVVEGNHNIGSVSERGISRRILETSRPRLLLDRPIAKIMDEALPTVSEDLPVEGIIPLLQRTQAVLTTKQGRITGIITNADLLKLIRRPES
jgi:predicted transcriptional regulator